MKTIFITIPWFSPAYKAGGPIQSINNLVNEFCEGVEYRIFCGNTDLNDEPLANIETGKWINYNGYTQVWYATTYKRSETLLKQVKDCKTDVLFIIGLFDWHFNIVPLVFCHVPSKIISVRGMLHSGALAEKSLKKAVFLNAWKMAGLHKKILFHATDPVEETFIKKTFGQSVAVKVGGNFPRAFSPVKRSPKQSGRLRMVSIALISPMKNHLLVLQALKESTGNIEYKIFGPVKDISYWQQCLSVIETMPENVKVIYEGDLKPEYVEAALQQAELFMLPSKSENFGHSIIEALSTGLPVITSKNTPWNELEENNAGMNVDTDTVSITAALKNYVEMDEAEYKNVSDAAIAYTLKRVNIDALKSQYKSMFNV